MTAVLPAKAGPTKSCCAPLDQVVDVSAPVVALAGAPNVGKSTLFNALTGARVTVGNWPGTSVEVARGNWTLPAPSGHTTATLIDLPGAYSLQPLSTDEATTVELLTVDDAPDVVIAIADAAHLGRSLYLIAQLRERALKLVVALTMVDVATNRGLEIDADALAAQLGCPVVPVDPRRRKGLGELKAAVVAQLAAPVAVPRTVPAAACPPETCDLAAEDERFAFIETICAAATNDCGQARTHMSDRIDRWVTGPISGPIIFLAAMWLIFQLTTTAAAPLQDGLDWLFSGPVSDGARWLLGAIGLSGTWVEGIIVDGLIAGVGMVLTFAPLMAIMFVLLALLEDSGYMARAAVVTDRLMRRIGLPGQAFLPLIVGFGCNVPAIAATRILPNARQRVLTSLLVPFTSCTARLPVYLVLGTVFFDRWAGTVVFGMYVTSILLVIGTGLALRATLWRTMGQEPLVLDLPPYQRPTLRVTAAVAWARLEGFLKTAGGIIVIVVTAVWLLQAIPAPGMTGGFGAVAIDDSVYAWLAQMATPLFSPAGFGHWTIVSGLLVGFVAKEAVISSWAQTFAVADPNEGGAIAGMSESLHAVFDQASGGNALPAVLAFCVFMLAYTPCVATIAAQKREIGTRWTIFGFVLQLVMAWALAVLVFQVGRLIV